MRKTLLISFIVSIVCLSWFNSAAATSKHLWNLQNADVRAIIDTIARQTGKNFIIDPRVRGKISIISTKPIDSKAAYQLFLSALSILGYSAIPSKGAIKIMPNSDARTLATPLVTDQNPGEGDELVARVVPVRYVSAIQLVPILRPMMSQWSNIAAYPPSNVIILAGRASNVARLDNIIQQVDRPEGNEVEVITLHHAIASKVVTTLQSLQNANRSLGKVTNVSLAADDESNKVLISGNPSARLRIRVLISQLDTSGSAGVNTRVIHLNYLDAKKLAPVLSAIAHSTSANTKGVATPSPGGSTATQTAIKADPESNSIVISAPAQVMHTIVNVIKQLDCRPRQVLVEAVIAQVDETMMHQLGVTWGTTTGDSPEQNPTDQGSETQLLQFPGMGMIKKGDLRALVAALNNNSSTNILSTPSIVVTDNNKANISVGKSLGVMNRQYSTNDNGSGDQTPYNTFSRQDVALSLEVTPHISPSRNVSLKITQKNDTLQNPTNPGNNPIINTNKINTTVMVNDGEILVLGGLISRDLTRGYNKIPFLGDLPLIGTFFQYQNKTADKKNLVVFIKPVVLRSGVNEEKITTGKYNYIRNLQLLKSEGIGLITNINDHPLLNPITKPIIKIPPPF